MLRELFHGILAVLRGVADIRFLRLHDMREALLQRLRKVLRVIERKRGLGHISDLLRIRYLKRFNVRLILHNENAILNLSYGPFNFRVPLMPDHHDRIAGIPHPGDLTVHLGDKGTRGVKHAETASSGLLFH